MSTTPGNVTADLEQIMGDLQCQLTVVQVERDEAQRLLTERTAERDASEGQKAALAEILQIINSSNGDVTPVFDAMLQRATRLCEAEFGQLALYDGKFFRFVAVHGALRDAGNGHVRDPHPPSYGITWPRLIAGETTVHIVDVAETDLYRSGHAGARRFVDVARGHTLLTAALHKDGVLLGALTVYRLEKRPFSEKQIALLENFAAQAVIAIENARLLAETREALEQQTATAEVLGVINSSPGDLTPVFDATLDKALALSEASFGLISTYQGDDLHRVVAMRGVPPQLAELLREPLRLGPETAMGRLVHGENFVHIADAADDQGYRLGNPNRRALVELGGARTHLSLPLRKDNVLLGAFTVYRQEVRPFTDKQIALLQNFAAQAVIAMDNARLITETREALEQQTATAEVLGVINSSPGDLTPVFDAILEKVHSLCGAERGVLFTCDGERLWPVAHVGPPRFTEAIADGFRPGPDNPFTRVLNGEPLVHIADIAQVAAQHPDDFGLRMARETGLRTFLILPLRKDDTLVGAITANRLEVRPFTDKQIALLQNFAAQAVIAIENARLITETREALAQQTATAEVLGVINSSPGDLAPVFDAMLEKAMRLCEAAFGVMAIRDGDRSRSVAARGVPAAFAEFRRNNPAPANAPIWGRLLNGEPFIHTVDLKREPAYQHHDPQRRALVDLGGARTSLAVALVRDGEVLGAIHIYRTEVRPFADKQVALLQNFAAQAVVAMENARLLGELRERTEEVAKLNRGLEARVAEQVEELGRVGRLKRFLAPQLAELIVSQGDEKILESHRREIVVVFCDLRGYTAFTETAEPEEVLDFLREYHGALGPLVSQFEGTLDQFSGDGIMVFFNDPVPCPDPAERAVKMAMAMREIAGTLIASWRERGRELGFGVGIAQGYATLGQIGFSERSGYTAIGTVCNVAARLCAEAKDGQILLGQRVNVALKGSIITEQLGAVALKGLTQPVVAYNVPLAASPPTLRVIEGGPQTSL